MGCCVSSSASDRSHCRHFPQSPSPAHDQEETVKEVLSETPISKPLSSSPMMIFQEKVEIQAAAVGTAGEVCQPSVDEVSEVCSEVFSAARSFEKKNGNGVNTHYDDDDDDGGGGGDGEVTQMVGRSPTNTRRGRRPCPGDSIGRKDRGGWGPPRRYSEPLPEGLNRVPSRTVKAPAASRRNGTLPGVGEPGRRRRSPAPSPDGGAARSSRGKSPPSFTSGQYSNGPPAPAAANGCAYENSNADESPTANETLENPLVSLECFIFL